MEEFVNQEDYILLIQFMSENRDGYVTYYAACYDSQAALNSIV